MSDLPPPRGGSSAQSADPLPSGGEVVPLTLPGVADAKAAKRQKREAEAALLREAVAIWNATCGDVLPAVAKLDDTRRQKLLERLREDCNGDLEVWRAYCERIRRSRFCCGENDRGWVGNIDWALRPATFAKVMEGVFDDREPKKGREL